MMKSSSHSTTHKQNFSIQSYLTPQPYLPFHISQPWPFFSVTWEFMVWKSLCLCTAPSTCPSCQAYLITSYFYFKLFPGITSSAKPPLSHCLANSESFLAQYYHWILYILFLRIITTANTYIGLTVYQALL